MKARLDILVRPRSRRAGIVGLRADGKLMVAVTAAPEDGRANEAVAAVLGESLRVRARDVTIVRGARTRAKQVEVAGIDEPELRRRIERALEAGE